MLPWGRSDGPNAASHWPAWLKVHTCVPPQWLATPSSPSERTAQLRRPHANLPSVDPTRACTYNYFTSPCTVASSLWPRGPRAGPRCASRRCTTLPSCSPGVLMASCMCSLGRWVGARPGSCSARHSFGAPASYMRYRRPSCRRAFIRPSTPRWLCWKRMLQVYVSSISDVSSRCCMYFIWMLLNLDRDVAHIVMAIHVCCKCMFQMFLVVFIGTLQVCVPNVWAVSSKYCMCFIWILHMLQWLYTYVSVCSNVFKRMLQWLYIYVASICL
jgi:hypothetical protein